MIRRFKTLGLAVVAVLAMSAVVASAASATNFTASKYPTAATAESTKGNEDWKFEAGTVECKGHFSFSSISEATEEIVSTPTYSECVAFGLFNAGVTFENCRFAIIPIGGWRIVPVVECQNITWHVGPCEMKVPPQVLNGVNLANSGSSITTQANITGITYTVTKDGFGCPFSGTGHKTGATYTQNEAITISSTNGASIDIG